jgi:ABC-type Fe3+-siderophore transport system permease subunit
MKKWLPALLLAAAFITSLYVGATQIDDFWSALINPGSNEILWQIRFPRVTRCGNCWRSARCLPGY